MSRSHAHLVVFLAGLAAVCAIGAGYAVSNPLAFAVTLLVGACYVAGALELRRYRHATATLSHALAGLSEPPRALGAWLDTLDPSLRNAVRARIEGARAALPGPALAPYLVGLLVLLGMLGTLLGMVVTLRGTGAALAGATDLQAIRASLAAPIRGLGFSFGTSIAGVSTSAMLGLLAALCRRERLDAARQLDETIATTLRVHTHAHQRDETFRLLQRQADTMPALVDRLQTMMAALERQSDASHERQIASQQAFLDHAQAAYAGLASSVGQSLTESAEQSARVAGAALRPVMEATMDGVARETAALHDAVTQAVQRQLDVLSSGFDATSARVADIWDRALDAHRQSGDALAERLRASLDRFVDAFEQRSAGLVDTVSARLDATAGNVSDAWNDALSRQTRINDQLADRHQQAMTAATATLEQHATSLLRTVGESHANLQTQLESRDEQRLAAWTESLGTIAATLNREWEAAGERTASRQQAIGDTLAQTARDIAAQTQINEQLADRHQQAITAAASTLEQHAAALLRTVGESHANLQTQLESRDEQRLAAWTESLGTIATTLNREWEAAGERTASRQQAICDTLARTAQDISEQTHAHARDTIAEIERLVLAASEAPKAAAEVVAELRAKLSDSMVRDTAMLDERSRLLATLDTLLDAVNHASTEQRSAVDALVSTSADLLERVGNRFTERIEAETGKLDGIAARVTGSAVEVASVGDAFGVAVRAFGESNDTLVAHLQRLEAALDKSLARSDEQLAYYVAQAREVVDLSMLSQKQIIEDLQRLAGQRASAGAEAA
ncbi:DUF802 domain-containing protein [Burkholderia guangdongensis]|uniref:DUF802 domain-containing protein n=1 Tax=Burkholderia guangdongensis TaxID=1792500 RepID=UPI0015C9E567|nr:DUF802 domain-containing protein [Burkholderia guangdongensis]